MSNYSPLTIQVERPDKVFLYNARKSANEYRLLLERAGIGIAGTIGTAPFADVPQLDLHSAREASDAPIVVFDEHPAWLKKLKLRDGFRKSILRLAEQGWSKRILHPSFVADFADTPIGDTAFITGRPGSGNILTQKIVQELLERYPRQNAMGENLLSRLCQHYDAEVQSYVEGVARGMGAQSIFQTSYGFGFVNYVLQFPHEVIHICDIRNRRHFYKKPYGTHQYLSRETADMLKQLQMPVFVCLRHPFDIFISGLHKARHDSENNPGRFIPSLDNSGHMFVQIRSAASYYKIAIDSCDNILLVRFEDLLTEPETTIRRMAQHLGVQIGEGEAAEIWHKFGMKPLQDAPSGHFREARVNGWKGNVAVETVDELVATEPMGFFRCLGYTADDLQPLDTRMLRERVAQFSVRQPMDRNMRKVGERITQTVWVEDPHSSAKIAERFRDRFDNEEFRLLCEVADHKATVRPASINATTD